MNKIVQVNIGGYPFTMDDDAYDLLRQYLDRIHAHFRNAGGYDEITADIEARLAELLIEQRNSRQIVSRRDVEAVITVMGKPEDFGAEPLDADEQAHASATEGGKDRKSSERSRSGKRLFRDPEDKVVGGVCSGLAAYFGIEDPLWIRLIWVFSLLTFGAGGILYLILMVIIPEAKSSADRLAMRGEPVNIDNIAKIIEEGAEKIATKVNEFSGSKGKDYTQKFRDEFGEGSRAYGVVVDIGSLVREKLSDAYRFLKRMLRPLGLILSVGMTLWLLGLWIVVIVGGYMMTPLAGYIAPTVKGASVLGFGNVFFLVGIPLFSMILQVSKSFFRIRYSPYLQAGMWGFWTLNVILTFFGATLLVRDFSNRKSLKQDIPVSFSGDTLYLKAMSHPEWDNVDNMGPVRANNNVMVLENSFQLQIERSTNGQYTLTRQLEAKGRTAAEAEALAASIEYPFEIGDNSITFSPDFVINKGTKFRNQRVEMTLAIPDGKVVVIDKPIKERLYAPKAVHDIWRYGQYWKMTPRGLRSLDPEVNEGIQADENGKLNISDFTKVEIKGPIEVIIERGDRFSVELEGQMPDYHLAKIEKVGNILRIDAENSDQSIRITMPSLEALDLLDTDDARIVGFSQDQLTLRSRGHMRVNFDGNIKELLLEAEQSEVTLSGSGNLVSLNADNGAEISAFGYKTRRANILTAGGSDIELSVSDTLVTKQSDSDNVDISGNPVIIKQ